MNTADRWFVCMLLSGAMLATTLHMVSNFILGNSDIITISIGASFFVALLMSPTYNEMMEYWRKLYGK